ncbi:hypothetical protein M9H77_12073 [Catharanthus roseus]|uniref:Uncharacterized protein n=1 Tax=Catharanthus roseus TaxID=4058 RepID=A0ACC0BGF8_CATRO|nr:hypothetical protein M9H77_12073 [Catharanthus roseus]
MMLGKKRMSKSIRESSGIKFCLCQAHEKPKEDKSKKRPVGRPRRSGVKLVGEEQGVLIPERQSVDNCNTLDPHPINHFSFFAFFLFPRQQNRCFSMKNIENKSKKWRRQSENRSCPYQGQRPTTRTLLQMLGLYLPDMMAEHSRVKTNRVGGWAPTSKVANETDDTSITNWVQPPRTRGHRQNRAGNSCSSQDDLLPPPLYPAPQATFAMLSEMTTAF